MASGLGTNAIFLAKHFDCQVVGADFSQSVVEQAQVKSREAGLGNQVKFKVADAECIPFDDRSFDVVVCKCAFCTFPGKDIAAWQFWRVLRPGGRIGLSDLTRIEPFPSELNNLIAWVACIADSQPIEKYSHILENGGFSVNQIEVHEPALTELIDEIRYKVLVAKLMVKLKKLDFPDRIDFNEVGRLGYALFTGEKEAD